MYKKKKKAKQETEEQKGKCEITQQAKFSMSPPPQKKKWGVYFLQRQKPADIEEETDKN